MTRLLRAVLFAACVGFAARASAVVRTRAALPANAPAPAALPRVAAALPLTGASAALTPSAGPTAFVPGAPRLASGETFFGPAAALLPLAAPQDAPAAKAPSPAAEAAASLHETAAAVEAAKPAHGTPAAVLSAAPVLGRFFDGWRHRLAPLTVPNDAPRVVFSGSPFLGKPAGESIREAAEASAGEVVPAPPAPPSDRDPAPRGGVPLLPRLLASAVALAAAVYFGLPLLVEGFSFIRAGLFLSAALPLAALPFLGKGAPFFLRTLPGTALTTNGLVLLFSGHAILAGLVAFLSGWGYRAYMRELWNGDRAGFEGFDAAVFLGAFGAVVAVGAAWAGMDGWLLRGALSFGALTSVPLLRHLIKGFRKAGEKPAADPS